MRFLFPMIVFLSACAPAPAQEPVAPQAIASIYWSDGDSGRITLADGTVIKFRLDDWDAPETGGVGAAIGGAKCEEERELGFRSKAFMVDHTRENASFTHKGEYDRHERLLVTMFGKGQDLAPGAEAQGLLASWKHDGGRQLEPRPDWCEKIRSGG